jgi:hypothetical protein
MVAKLEVYIAIYCLPLPPELGVAGGDREGKVINNLLSRHQG